MVEKPIDAEDIMLQKCKSLIQAKLGWEDGGTWTNHDFQMLSEKIQTATNINLSVATLKRLWGKVKYESKPTITTLNTLSQFIGYENWRAFKQSNAEIVPVAVDAKISKPVPPSGVSVDSKHGKSKNFWRSGLVGTALCGGVLFIFLYAMRKDNDQATAQYTFSSKKVVSEGVPNSVIFDYDATAAPVDCVYIQQSWDQRLRTKVNRDQRQHTSIYYLPGFFQAKLVVNNEIVKEHNLWITSNGWMAIVKQDPVPIYFKDDDFRKPGILSLPIDKLKENNISLQPETPWTAYYNVQDFGDIRTEDFIFETKVRSDYKEGAGICQMANIVLLLEGTVIVIPLSIKGCVSDLFLTFDDQGFDGKKTDLSAFGCDLSNWVKVRCEGKNNKGRIFINDQLAFEGKINSSKKIVGMIFRFQGTGSVDEVRLSSSDEKKFVHDTF